MNKIFLSFLIFFNSFAQNNEKEHIVQIETQFGNIKIKLYNETPKHRDNFIKLAKENFYDGTIFHRVIPGFVIQGGDPDSKDAPAGEILGEGGPGYTLAPEIKVNKGIFHKRGAVAAARMPDDVNPSKRSSGSQFYIVIGKKYTNSELDKLEKRMGMKFSAEQRKAYTTIGGTPHLDGNYTVFGEVIEGMNVVDEIASLPTDKHDRPLSDIVITVKVLE